MQNNTYYLLSILFSVIGGFVGVGALLYRLGNRMGVITTQLNGLQDNMATTVNDIHDRLGNIEVALFKPGANGRATVR